MRIGATCRACGRDFLFFQLYHDPWQPDRCPHCNIHLGFEGVRHLALTAERGVADLVAALDGIAMRNPTFTIHTDTIVPPIEAAIAIVGDPDDERDERTASDPNASRRPWRRRSAA